jgi:hypothetical protein
MTKTHDIIIRTETSETWVVRRSITRRHTQSCPRCGELLEAAAEKSPINTPERNEGNETES